MSGELHDRMDRAEISSEAELARISAQVEVVQKVRRRQAAMRRAEKLGSGNEPKAVDNST